MVTWKSVLGLLAWTLTMQSQMMVCYGTIIFLCFLQCLEVHRPHHSRWCRFACRELHEDDEHVGEAQLWDCGHAFPAQAIVSYLGYLSPCKVGAVASESLLKYAEEKESKAGGCIHPGAPDMPGAEPQCDVVAELKGHLHHHHVHGRRSRGHGHPHTATAACQTLCYTRHHARDHGCSCCRSILLNEPAPCTMHVDLDTGCFSGPVRLPIPLWPVNAHVVMICSEDNAAESGLMSLHIMARLQPANDVNVTA